MVGAHVAHDCVVGDHVILANNATLGGHVEVGDYVILGGLAAVQQIAASARTPSSAGSPASTATSSPTAWRSAIARELGGLNIVGLKRRGFDRPTIHALRAAYQAIFNGGGTRAERIDRGRRAISPMSTRCMTIVDFIRTGGDRPLCAPRRADRERAEPTIRPTRGDRWRSSRAAVRCR